MSVIRRVSLSLLIAVVVPAVLFYAVFVTAGVWSAIVAALAWSYGAIGVARDDPASYVGTADPDRRPAHR